MKPAVLPINSTPDCPLLEAPEQWEGAARSCSVVSKGYDFGWLTRSEPRHSKQWPVNLGTFFRLMEENNVFNSFSFERWADYVKQEKIEEEILKQRMVLIEGFLNIPRFSTFRLPIGPSESLEDQVGERKRAT